MAMAAPRRDESSTSRRTVTVACSLPIGATLHLEQSFEVNEAVMAGGVRVIKQWRKVGEPVHLRGTKNRTGGEDPDSPIADGYALTFGVDEEFMDAWWAQNQDWQPVKAGMIRYASNRADIKAMTKENANQRTGLEPFNPKGDARAKGVTSFSR